MNISSKAFLGLIVFLSLTISSANAQHYNNYKLNGKVKSFYIKTYDNSKDGYLDTINPSEYVFVDFQNRKETKIYKKNERELERSVTYYNENKNIILDSDFFNRNIVEVNKYYYDLKGNNIKLEQYQNDSIESTIFYKYDRFSNLIEEFTDYNGKSSYSVLYTYDSNNNHISTSYVNYEYEGFSSYEVMEYNKKGQLIKEYSPETKDYYTIYKYDKKGNLIEEIEYENNECSSKTIYKYNSKNKRIKEESYSKNKLSSTSNFIYDSLNRMIQRIFWMEEFNSIPTKEVVKFDKKGRLIKRKTYRVNAPYRIQTYKYKGDNLIQEIVDEPTDPYNQTQKFEYTFNPDNTLSRKFRYSYVGGVRESIKWEESVIEEYYYNREKQNTFIKTIELYSENITSDSLIYENGLLIKRFDEENNNIQTTYKYDEKGRLLEEDIDGFYRKRIIYKYDNDTLIYKQIDIIRDNKLDYSVTETWEYDSNKRLIIYIYNHPNFSSLTNYFYDSKGKLQKTISKNNKVVTNTISNYKYKLFSRDYEILFEEPSKVMNIYYKYDDKGNLLEERYPFKLVRYEYEYYE